MLCVDTFMLFIFHNLIIWVIIISRSGEWRQYVSVCIMFFCKKSGVFKFCKTFCRKLRFETLLKVENR